MNLIKFENSLLQDDAGVDVGSAIDRPGDEAEDTSGLVGAVIALSVVAGLALLAAVAILTYIKRERSVLPTMTKLAHYRLSFRTNKQDCFLY